MSFDRLQEKIDRTKNPVVIGLDPDLAHIPPEILQRHISQKGETLKAAAMAVLEFNIGLIDALHDIVPAVKPQLAYYEALGMEGVAVLKETASYAKEAGMYVIGDGKRNDIGSTAAAYAAAYLGAINVGDTEIRPFDFDALTINAYLGTDGVAPFLEAASKYDKAVFTLVRTSNPSAAQFQDLTNGELKLYTAVGDLMEEFSRDTIGNYGYSRVGAVVGATYPEEMTFLRKRLKNTFFLVPGYGAQGGKASDAVQAFDADGRGAVINSSRAVIAAWKKSGGNYKDTARAEAQRMQNELQMAVILNRF